MTLSKLFTEPFSEVEEEALDDALGLLAVLNTRVQDDEVYLKFNWHLRRMGRFFLHQGFELGLRVRAERAIKEDNNDPHGSE